MYEVDKILRTGVQTSMPFRFLITNALPVEGSPDAESVSEKLQKKGFLFTEDQIAEDYRWKDMPWGWGLRTSIVRIVHFKLLGTGFAAFLTATSPNTGSFTAYSCALCAAVNFIAVAHYLLIWRIRAQNIPDVFAPWRARTNKEYRALLKAGSDEEAHGKAIRLGQEMAVDGLRHSDWVRFHFPRATMTPVLTPRLRVCVRRSALWSARAYARPNPLPAPCVSQCLPAFLLHIKGVNDP